MSGGEMTADRMHAAIRTLMAHLATGGCPWGDSPTIPVRDLLESPEVQELSASADAWER